MTLGLRNALITILFFFLCLFLFIRFGGPLSINSVQTTKTDFFTADGTGEVKATATQAHFSVGVTEVGTTEQDAKNQMNTVMNTVITDLKSLGIAEKDIKTSNFSVYPNPTNNVVVPLDAATNQSTPGVPLVRKGNVGGFTATQELDIQASTIDLANKALDSAISDGANQIAGVSFNLDDATQKSLEIQARKLAIADAKKNAQELASEAGIILGRIVNVSENNSPQAFGVRTMAAEKTDSTATNLQPGENTISVTVTLSYETR